jgi:multidrug efflux system membrane fusion protein
MDYENSRGTAPDGPALGASFEQHTSHNLGSSFAASTSTPLDPHRRPGYVKRSRTWVWVVIGLVLVAGILLIRHFSKDSSAASAKGGSGATAGKAGNGRGQQGPAAITVGQSKSGNIDVYVDTLGTVTPLNTITVYSQITGTILAVHYREGQLVRKGQPLIDIDPRPYQANLATAEGTLQRDHGVLAEAKIDLARYQAAYAKNAIARQQLEDQEQTVVQDQGTVKADQGTVDYDKVELAYCHIVAPISGKVGLRLVDPGNTVFSGSSSTLVVITQMQPITVVFNVSEDDLPQVQAQLHGRQALEVDAFDRGNDKQLESGKLTSLNNEVDTTTGTVKFRATFPNKDLVLYPNQFVNARLKVRTLVNATLVPNAAVQHNGTASFVYVVKSGPNNSATVAVQSVMTSTSDDQVTAVQGIGPGVEVATSGFDRLENGVKVLVHQGTGQKNSASATTSGTSAP